MHICLIGCGHMGRALLQGWLNAPPTSTLILSVIDPQPPHDMGAPCLSHYPNIAVWSDQTSAKADIVVLAVKPQSMDDVCAALTHALGQPMPLVISIAAGKTLSFYEAYFGANTPIIRAMPNTPGAIGQGISAYIGNAACTQGALTQGAALLTPLGTALNLADYACDESMMDVVTALSGSGPAYLYALTEAMAQAGTALGLPQHLADMLARTTIEGTGALMAHAGPSQTPTALRQAVTSPAGTTEAALAVLAENQAFSMLMLRAIEAATHRAKKLSS